MSGRPSLPCPPPPLTPSPPHPHHTYTVRICASRDGCGDHEQDDADHDTRNRGPARDPAEPPPQRHTHKQEQLERCERDEEPRVRPVFQDRSASGRVGRGAESGHTGTRLPAGRGWILGGSIAVSISVPAAIGRVMRVMILHLVQVGGVVGVGGVGGVIAVRWSGLRVVVWFVSVMLLGKQRVAYRCDVSEHGGDGVEWEHGCGV